MVEGYGRGQLELALMELAEKPEDEPSAVMTRIEEITRKADSAMETKDLNILKRNAFMRLIRSNKSMYHYINRKAASHSDPYEALRLAKEHIRDFGHESQAVIEMTKRMLQLSGVQVPEISMSSGFLQVPVAGQSLTRSTPNISDLPDAGKPAATRKESFMNYNDMAASEERLDARFLSKGHKPTPDEITYRLNQFEKFQRDFGAGLIYPGYRNEEEKSGEKNSDRKKRWNKKGNDDEPDNRQSRSSSRGKGNYSKGRGGYNKRKDEEKERKPYKVTTEKVNKYFRDDSPEGSADDSHDGEQEQE